MHFWLMQAQVALVCVAAAGRQEGPTQDPPAKDAPSQDAPASQEQGAGQPPRSQALEELLRRLNADRPLPSVVPPNVAPPPDTAPPPVEAPTEDETAIRVTRVSDPVQAVQSGKRRDLQYWDPLIALHGGDEVRQGPKSCTLAEYADGAHYRFDGVAIWRPLTDANANPRLFEVVRLERLGEFHLGRGDVNTVLILPGGNQLAGYDARVTIRDWDRRALEIMNTGPEPVVLKSPYLGQRLLTLDGGKRVLLPVLAEPSATIGHLDQELAAGDAATGGLVVKAQKELTLAAEGDGVTLHGSGPIPGIARANGARVVLAPGEQLRLRRAPLGFPRQKEWDE